MSVRPIVWNNGTLSLLDQRALPLRENWLTFDEPEGVARAIEDMVVRGAPAIGVTAAYGLTLAARVIAQTGADPARGLAEAFDRFARTRPTAVNLFWAIKRMKRLTADPGGGGTPDALAERFEAEARRIESEDVEANRAMGRHGADLLPDPCTVLTHCNAGALATAGYGTALGVIRAAVEAGKTVSVLADETRPFLQGARLTAWELHRDHIPVTVLTDGMAGWRMRQGGVHGVVVGADRIAANGDAANKIGTYGLSILAREHGVPFYVAAPLSTVDFDAPDGDAIPIEERNPAEVTHCGATRTVPEGVSVWNPAFDVTPAANITAIITEAGVARAPFNASLRRLTGR